jgi:hypothetical protein
VRILFCFGCLLWSAGSTGQTLYEEDRFVSQLKRTEVPPADLLSARSAVLFSSSYTQKELEEIQKGFQQMGIDAVSYVESERALAGRDLMNAYSRYFTRRTIKFLIFMRKDKQDYQLNFVPFNATSNWTEPDQNAWFVHASGLNGLLGTVFRSLTTHKRQNFLVNDYPERSGPLSAVSGRRLETFAPNLMGLKIAVPKTGEPTSENELEVYLSEHFQVKYELVDPATDEKELQQKGFIYVLRFIHAPGSLAKEILGYDMSKSESALASVTYPNGALQLKTIPSEYPVYKFYIKNMEDDIFYLGPKWDADVTWPDALRNYVDGYRAAGKIN